MLDEARRLEVLYAYRILDTVPEGAFDALVQLAAQICEVPIALVSLVDRDRQWFKACVGLDVQETPRQVAFCNYTIANPDGLCVVPDAQVDPRFAANPLVTGPPFIRFYAGAPLVAPSGEALGSLCVIDRVPRDLRPDQLNALTLLAKQVVDQMELRRQVKALEVAQAKIQRYADLFAGDPTGLLVWHLADLQDPTSLALLEANPSASHILGFDLAPFLGQTILDIFPAAADLAVVYAQTVLKQQLQTWSEIYYRDERIEARYFSVTAHPLPDHCLGLAFEDMTRRVEAEHNLQAGQTRLEALVQATNDVLWEWTPARNRVQWLYGLDRFFGYSETETSLDWWQERVHPDDCAQACETLAAAAANPDSLAWEATYRFRKADGTYAIVFDRGLTERDSEGRALRVIGGISDLTAQYRMQSALHDASQRLDLHMRNSPLAVAEWDHELRCLRWSERATEIFGWQEAEALGKRAIDDLHLIHEDDIERVWQQLTGLFAGQQPYLINRNRNYTAKGEIRICEWYNSVLYDAAGVPTSLLTFAADVTLQAMTEQLLRSQAELLDVASDAIAVVPCRNANIDLTAPFQYWNHSAEKLLGYSAIDARSRSPLDVLLTNKSPNELTTILSALNQGVWRGELTLKTPRGAQLTLDSRWTVVHDERNQPHSLLIVNTDITTQKVMELQMLRSQRLESVGTLASGIAHDLNNVFSPILIAASLLQETLSIDERSQRWLNTLHASALRGASLVKQVLSFSRGLSSEKTLLQPKYIIDEVLQVAQETFPKSLHIQVAGDRPWLVEADATQLHQVVMNLMVNSRDAMPQGGTIRLEHTNLELSQPQIDRYTTIPAGRYVCLSISDQGCGIADDVIDHIFEPFFTTKAPGQGTGLGLSTTLGIIQNHGGYITVESSLGQGSCFRVYLAAAADHVASAEPPSMSPNHPRGHGTLILIVDDEPAIRAMASAALSRQGYRVQTAHNGVDALRQMSEETAAIVLVDMMMPVMDGAQTLSVLARLYPQTHLIAMSGEATEHPEGVPALPKPFTMAQLLSAVQARSAAS